jgi:hypothetical protein
MQDAWEHFNWSEFREKFIWEMGHRRKDNIKKNVRKQDVKR